MNREIDFRCQSISTVIKDKKDFLLVKLFGMHFKMLNDPKILNTL